MPRLNPRGSRRRLQSAEARRGLNRQVNARRNLFPDPENQVDNLGVQPMNVDQQVHIPNNQHNENDPVFEPIDDHIFFDDVNLNEIPQPIPLDNVFNPQSMDDPQFLNLRREFVDKIDNIHQLICQFCNEKQFIVSEQIDQTCSKCTSQSHREKFSADNNMDPGQAVPQLTGLTPVEQLLIAQVNPNMTLMRLPRGGQYAFRGHVLNVPQDVNGFITNLPRRVDQLDILVLKKQGSDPTLPPSYFTVNRERVYNALTWLRENNRYYHNIHIVQEHLQALPENGLLDIPPANILDEIDINQQQPNPEVNEEAHNQEGNLPPQNQNLNPHQPPLHQPQNVQRRAPPDVLPPLNNPPHHHPPLNEHDPHIAAQPRQHPVIPNTFAQVQRPGPNERAAIQAAIDNDMVMQFPQRAGDPINEFTTEGYIAKAFPCLFPTGNADFKAPRRTKVSAQDYFIHLLRYHDGRFENDPRFVFLASNSVMRWKALQTGAVFARNNPNDAQLTAQDIRLMLNEDRRALTNRILSYGKTLRGSPQYWFSQRKNLMAMINQLGNASVFFTFSVADHHWPDLRRFLDTDGRSIHEAIAHSPLTVDSYVMLRFQIFFDHFLSPYLQVEDYWYRIEWQHRGSLHIHGLAWLENVPDALEATERHIAEYWDRFVNSWNPAMQPGDNPLNFFWYVDPNQHPCAKQLRAINVEELDRDLKDLVNMCQKHTRCTPGYCLRVMDDGQQKCRFNFPKPIRNLTTAVFTHDDNGQRNKLEVHPATNDAYLNKYNSHCLSIWRANMDISITFNMTDVAKYIAKYTSKAEQATNDYAVIMNAIATDQLPGHANLKAVANSLLLKTISSNDICAQQAAHILSDMPLVKSSRHFVTCSVESNYIQDPVNGNGYAAIRQYMNRPDIHEQSSFLTIFSHFTFRRRQERVTLVQRRGGKAILQIIPRYSNNPDDPSFPDYCMQFLILHKPFRRWADLLFGFQGPLQAYQHFIDNNPQLNRDPHNMQNAVQQAAVQLRDEQQQPLPEPEVHIDPWMYLHEPDHPLNLPLDNEAQQLNDNFDWLAESDPFHHLIQPSRSFLLESKQAAENNVEPQPQLQNHYNPDQLNAEQRQVFDAVLQHMQQHDAPPLSMLVLGTAGTGKSFLINCLSQLLHNSVTILAPTGVAAANIHGSTLHSHLQFAKLSTFAQLRGPSLQRLQDKFADTRYLIIDEVSMIGCSMLNAINKRLQQAFPQHSDQPFGGCSLILFGDFGQLPPVGDSRLFHPKRNSPTSMLGHVIYRTIQRVTFLTHCVRQANDEGFRDLLLRLRNGISTYDDYIILSRRFEGVVDQADFVQAVRLFPTRQLVAEHNADKLVALNRPIATFESAHNVNQAKNADSDTAGGLERWLSLAIGAHVMLRSNLWVEKGLVNGTLGTVMHIIFHREGPPALPATVICNFPSYTGPPFLPDVPGSFPVTPITRTWLNGNTNYSRTGFPLMLSWALTIHKCQGLTLDQAVVNIGDHEMSPGLSFVALSRARTVNNLMLAPFEFERISRLDRLPSVVQRKDEERRLQLL